MSLVIKQSNELQVKQCKICNRKANRSHYGVIACNSCGSYFRRTILLKRNYLCAKKNCHLTGSGPMCKRCRLQMCIELGMTIDSILIRKVISSEDQFKYCTLLTRSINALDSTFVNKMNILSKLAHKNNMRLEMSILKPGKQRMEISKIAEYKTLLLYLKDCGYSELGIGDIDLAKIAERSFYRWLFYSGLMSTLRYGGHQTNTIHLSDCGYLPLSLDSCCDYLKEHKVGDIDVLGKPYFELLNRAMKIAQRFHQAHLDKTEVSLLLHLLILKEAKELFPYITKIGDQINELLRQINKYHSQNYEDVAVRFGDLILLLCDINQVDAEHRHFSQLLLLTGFDTVLPRMSLLPS